ncbi:MAG: aminoacyl-tRNA hydrolase [Gammaproteobacteria bacterium]|jgi:PTH1 family peptidyl-tRNA hydrolase|nr:aminoacyl-tRNA hydrolase [Gammaproteobacteria bacterium]
MSAIQLIAGLANPGEKYRETRHNAGQWFVERLLVRTGASLVPQNKLKADIAKVTLGGNPVWLLVPQTFMNLSGEALVLFLNYYRIAPANLLVAHDEIDLPPGTVRLKRGGGAGGHNGLSDVIQHLGTRDFHRLRIGVGHPGHADQVVSWVLRRPGGDERIAIDNAVQRAAAEVDAMVAGEFERVMNVLHTRGPDGDEVGQDS